MIKDLERYSVFSEVIPLNIKNMRNFPKSGFKDISFALVVSIMKNLILITWWPKYPKSKIQNFGFKSGSNSEP